MNFLSVFREILKGKGLIHDSCNRYMQTLQLHYLNGLLSPFCFSSKRYQIPFSSMQKGIRYRMQNQKIAENKTGLYCIACGNKTLHAACNRVTFREMQKIIKYSLKQLA